MARPSLGGGWSESEIVVVCLSDLIFPQLFAAALGNLCLGNVPKRLFYFYLNKQ